MLAVAKIAEVQQLLAEGKLSHRAIARVTGVSRASISGIASGSRPDYAQRQKEREAEALLFSGPVARCPGCGGMVLLPCLLCRVRKLKERQYAVLQLRRQNARAEATRHLIAALRQVPLGRDPLSAMSPSHRRPDHGHRTAS